MDAGTGLRRMGLEFVRAGGRALTLLNTHYHHDHTEGFGLSVFPYLKGVPIEIWGPHDRASGPREIYRQVMRAPHFPVEYDAWGSHIVAHDIKTPNIAVLLFHPLGGVKYLRLDEFENLYGTGKQMPFHGSHKFALQECLMVTMFKSNHPEQTISYRFTEFATGQSFCFLTDHENQNGIAVDLKRHGRGVNLLIEDCQYTEKEYQERKTGWGHASSDYVAQFAVAADVGALGLTHHDPGSTNADIDGIVTTTRGYMYKAGKHITVFGCFDGLTIDVGNVAESVAIAQQQHKQQLVKELEYLIANH